MTSYHGVDLQGDSSYFATKDWLVRLLIGDFAVGEC